MSPSEQATGKPSSKPSPAPIPVVVPPEPTNARAYYYDLSQMPDDMEFPTKERYGDFPYYASEDISKMLLQLKRENKEIFGSGRVSNIGAIFEGYIEFPAEGYKLCLRAQDAGELYLDDVLIGSRINADKLECFDVEDSSPGTVRRVEMRYKNMNPDSNVVRLDWKPPTEKSVPLTAYDFLPAPVSFIHIRTCI